MSPFEETCKRIQDLHSDMKELTLAAGVSEDIYNKVIETHPDLTMEEVSDRLTFLETIRSGPYADLNYTWLLLPPFVWQGYLDMGIRNYPEQKKLREQRKVVREAWEKKYKVGRLRKLTDEELEADENLHSSKTDQSSTGPGSPEAN